MKPTRKMQPYRQGARQPGQALNMMLRGRTVGGWNPKDIERQNHPLLKAGKRAMRKQRMPRAPRPPR